MIFLRKYVRGRDEIDYAAIFRGIGLQFEQHAAGGRAYIGADMADEGGRLNIKSVPASTPAYEQGLNTGDQIVAIDGYRASMAFLTNYLAEKKPNETVKLTIFRLDRIREVPFVLGEDKRHDYEISPVAEPSGDQKKLYQQYLLAEL